MASGARRRLAVHFLALFSVVILVSSIALWLAFALALDPEFEISQPIPSREAEETAYQRELVRLGVGFAIADLVIIALVAGASWWMAKLTLDPVTAATDHQKRFIEDASHEIRTPLAAIRATAGSALARDADAEELRASLGHVLEDADRLSALANGLLELARPDRPQAAPHIEAFDLSVLVAERIEEFRRLTQSLDSASANLPEGGNVSSGPSVSVELGTDLLVAGDPDASSRVVANLLENAARYGRGQIQVRTGRDGRWGYVDVFDDGPGIAPEDRERIFQPFFRVDKHGDAPAGTGLGLAIAAQLTRQQRGRLTVRSDPPAGATFRLQLPATGSVHIAARSR